MSDPIERYARLQARLRPLFEHLQSDPLAPRTVVVVPGLSLDLEVLAKVSGVRHYEERQLSMLMLLRYPRTRVVFVTSTPVADSVVDYYLHLLAGIPATHARQRLILLSAHDASACSLTAKILQRPRLLARPTTLDTHFSPPPLHAGPPVCTGHPLCTRSALDALHWRTPCTALDTHFFFRKDRRYGRRWASPNSRLRSGDWKDH